MFETPRLPAGGSVFRLGQACPYDGHVFCDGTVRKGIAGGGWVVLDARGCTLDTGCERMPEPTLDSTAAEFFALLQALQHALSRGLRSVWVGSDSYQLIEHLHKRTARYAAMRERFDELCAGFDSLCVQAIERIRNKRADELARTSLASIR